MKKILTLTLAFLMLLTNNLSASKGNGLNSQVQEVSNSKSLDANETSSELINPKRRGGGGGGGKKKVWFYVLAGVFVVVLVLYVAAGGTPELTVG